ncbi:hypothetical protein P9112_009934 [Eukaryota sp. TZLM1-RC]
MINQYLSREVFLTGKYTLQELLDCVTSAVAVPGDQHIQDATQLADNPVCPPSPPRPGLAKVEDWSDAERSFSELSSSQSVGETYGGATVCSTHNRHRCQTCKNNRDRTHHLLNHKDDDYLDLNDPNPPTESDPDCIWCQYNSDNHPKVAEPTKVETSKVTEKHPSSSIKKSSF